MHAYLRPLTSIAAAAVLFAASFVAPAADAQVATVNGVAIPQARLDVFLKMLAANKQPDTPEVRSRVREQLINQEVLSQEAVKKGIHKNPEIVALLELQRQQLELQRQELLVNALAQDYIKANPLTDEIMRKEFERIKLTLPTKEYKARHIVLEKEDEAKEVIAQLKKGGNFEKIAADKSKDAGSKGRGGDLDWVGSGLPKPFGDALAKLKKGQMTDAPVQTDYGWHVIRLDDERPIKVPPFEEAKPKIQQMMQGAAVQKMLADIRAKAKVE